MFYFFIAQIHRSTLSLSLKRLQNVNGSVFLSKQIYIKRFHAMTDKSNTRKSYVTVNVLQSESVNSSTRVRKFFQRHRSTKTQRLKKADLSRLFSLAKSEKWTLFGAVCLLFISSAVTMAVPFSLGKVLDIIYTNNENSDDARQKLNKLCGILIAVFLLGGICNFGRVYLMSTSGYRMTQALRLKVFSSILRQEQGWFDNRSTGELVNRLSSDTQIVGYALTTNISDGLRSTIMVLAGSGMMFYMSPKLALVSLTVVPPVAVIAIIYGRYVRNITKEVQDKLAAASQVAEERISNMKTVKSFGRESLEMDRYKCAIEKVLLLGYNESRARAIFFGMTGLTGNVIIISVLYYGGVMVSAHDITVGNLSSFLLYAAYIGVSLGGLSSFYSELNKAVGAATRLWEIVDRQPAMPVTGGSIPIKEPEGHIQFNDIQFKYPSRSNVEVLNDVKLDISPGKTVAVVGPSGSGKSTLAALLLRLYDPTKGNVLLDGQDVRNLDPKWIKRCIGTVSQEPVLFSCSIRDNILYGADCPEKITEEKLTEVAKEANVLEFVQQLPEGFNTLVGERGIMLSGGQKQRIAIARALIKDPKILLLDEATSALDAQSESLVREALERVMKGRTVLTIAHRLSTIQNADVIAVLKNGTIVEQGTYNELLAKKGAFKELIKHQTFQEV
ncbi:ATP-binding cassette sub-family B member 10, mitochondrial [Agrilus planipennis]|uniref:ATP-binding cassette sub-family B member 10, mitochondrial n=1 Tax=Agrilus planipennis TaxID=224129 RepID=A0A7F5RGW5_AGRPL|nr:ATP-binding cassette sub-family B member 10, mitochondrial [Agrilus planipennis]